jgi:hypothetical protein
MNIVISLSPDGQTRSFYLDHKLAHMFFDGKSLQFCGAVENAVALTRLNPLEKDISNLFAIKFPQYFEPTLGEILLLGSDVDGLACDLDVPSILNILNFG